MTTALELLTQAQIALAGFPDNRCAAEAYRKITAFLQASPAPAEPGAGKRVHLFTALSNADIAAELCRRMAAGKVLDDSYEQGTPGELDTVDEAKDICRDLLRAAKRDGLGGCLLCAG